MGLTSGSLVWEIGQTLSLNICFSALTGLASFYFVKNYIPIFIARGLLGGDKCKVS
jgi:hypothetical protein